MATSSSSDESAIAPTDFKFHSSFSDSNGAVSVAVERCPLCLSRRRPFTCCNCLVEGNFIHSSRSSVSELSPVERDVDVVDGDEDKKYISKLERWHALKTEKTNILERFKEIVSHRDEAVKKHCDVLLMKERLNYLKEIVRENQTHLKQDDMALQDLKDKNISKSAKFSKYREKVARILKYIRNTRNYIEKHTALLNKRNEELSHLRQDFIFSLVKHIFPIEQVQHKSDNGDSLVQSTVCALAEARRTSYVRGKWVYVDNGSEHRYMIVEPDIPGNGDYSAYHIKAPETKSDNTCVSSDEGHCLPQRSSVHAITAALSYTTQLVLGITSILNINLLSRMCYSEFCSDQLSDKKFERTVYKLNSNVLHLCFTQHVDPDLLQPVHTLHNILTLLKSPTLGRAGHFAVNEELVHIMFEDNILSASDTESEASDDNDGPGGWETVPTNLPEMDIPNISCTSSTSSQTSRVSTTESTMGGVGYMSTAAASVASLWRAATGQSEKR